MIRESQSKKKHRSSERPLRILLIDDSPEMGIYVSSIMHDVGLEHFENPLDSYSALPTADLVLLDYDMPGVTGLEYLHFLEQDYPDLPVVMITGQGSEDVCLEAFQHGVRNYIKKPFLARELREVVFRILDRRQRPRPEGETKPSIPPDVYNKLYSAKHHIDVNISGNIRLDDVLRLVGMSKAPFERYFKKMFGSTFRDYYQGGKIRRAEELLKRGFSVTDVAESLGFGDIAHFTKTFKKHTGIPPSHCKPRES